MSGSSVVIFVISIILTHSWLVRTSQDREVVVKKVKDLSRSLQEAFLELADLDEKERKTLFPRSCQDIRKVCAGNLPTKVYAVYSTKKIDNVDHGFMLRPKYIHCPFDGKVSADDISSCRLPEESDVSRSILPTNCMDIQRYYRGIAVSGIYDIYNPKWSAKLKKGIRMKKKKVYCDMEQAGGGWTVIQRRVNGEEDFNVGWDSYAEGFGDPSADHWIGNRALHSLTRRTDYVLRIEAETQDGEKMVANYQHFKVGPESDLFRLTLDVDGELDYQGTADDLISYQNGMTFSTRDADNDYATYNCARTYSGGWWFKSCTNTNLNGEYNSGDYQGIWWKKPDNLLKKVVMMIRPRFIP